MQSHVRPTAGAQVRPTAEVAGKGPDGSPELGLLPIDAEFKAVRRGSPPRPGRP
jgi:hypothetical protein